MIKDLSACAAPRGEDLEKPKGCCVTLWAFFLPTHVLCVFLLPPGAALEQEWVNISQGLQRSVHMGSLQSLPVSHSCAGSQGTVLLTLLTAQPSKLQRLLRLHPQHSWSTSQLAWLRVCHKFFKWKCGGMRYFRSSPLQRVSVLMPIRFCLFVFALGFCFVFEM